MGDVPVIDVHATRIRRDEADDHVERGGLPRPVRAQQPDDLALPQRDVDLIHDAPLLVDLDQLLRADPAALDRDRGFDLLDRGLQTPVDLAVDQLREPRALAADLRPDRLGEADDGAVGVPDLLEPAIGIQPVQNLLSEIAVDLLQRHAPNLEQPAPLTGPLGRGLRVPIEIGIPEATDQLGPGDPTVRVRVRQHLAQRDQDGGLVRG